MISAHLGGVAERSNAAVFKTAGLSRSRRFESYRLRTPLGVRIISQFGGDSKLPSANEGFSRKKNMSNEPTIDFTGNSGATYRYWFLSELTAAGIKVVAGNYAFVKRLPNGNFVPLYFGQAENLQDRIPTHERWADAVRAGATNVVAHSTQGGEKARLDEERDLIQRWNPALNVQHRTVS